MKEIADYLAAMISFGNTINVVNTALGDVQVRIKQMDERITKLTRDLDRFDAAIVTPTGKFQPLYEYSLASNKGIAYSSVAEERETRLEQGKTNNLTDDIKNAVSIASSFGKIADSGMRLYETVEELPATLKKVKKGIGFFNGFMEALDGGIARAEVSEIAMGAAAVSGILAGAEEIALAGASMGPAGLVVAASALLVGSAVAIASRKTPAEEAPDTFIEQGIRNKNQYLINHHNSTGSIDEISEKAKRPEEKTQAQITAEIDALKNSLLKRGGTILFDSDRAETKDPIYLPGLIAALNENERVRNPPIKKVLFDDGADLNSFRIHFDTFDRFPLDAMPEIRQKHIQYLGTNSFGIGQYGEYESAISQKNFRRQSHPSKQTSGIPTELFMDSALKSLIRSYETNGLEYVTSGYNDELRRFGAVPGFRENAQNVWKWFQKAKPEVDGNSDQQLYRTHQVPSNGRRDLSDNSSGENRRSVTINLNKSMIENFTISTRNMKEGISDFKHKVEEVLIEILNSANVI